MGGHFGKRGERLGERVEDFLRARGLLDRAEAVGVAVCGGQPRLVSGEAVTRERYLFSLRAKTSRIRAGSEAECIDGRRVACWERAQWSCQPSQGRHDNRWFTHPRETNYPLLCIKSLIPFLPRSSAEVAA